MKYNLSLTPEQWRKIIDALFDQSCTNKECFSLVNVMVEPVVSFHCEFNLSLTPEQWRNIVYVLINQTSNNVECYSLVNVMCNFGVSFDDDKEG